MTTFPKPAAKRVPATIKDHGARMSRAEARLDDQGSKAAKNTADIATANTNITTNTTSITANTTAITSLNSHLGSTAQQTFLGSLSKMPHIGVPSGSASHSGVGTISGTPTDVEFNALNTAYNNTADFINTVATVLAGLLSELQASNYES